MMSLEAVKEKWGGVGPKRESLFTGPPRDFNTSAITISNTSADTALFTDINVAVKALINLHISCILETENSEWNHWIMHA